MYSESFKDSRLLHENKNSVLKITRKCKTSQPALSKNTTTKLSSPFVVDKRNRDKKFKTCRTKVIYNELEDARMCGNIRIFSMTKSSDMSNERFEYEDMVLLLSDSYWYIKEEFPVMDMREYDYSTVLWYWE